METKENLEAVAAANAHEAGADTTATASAAKVATAAAEGAEVKKSNNAKDKDAAMAAAIAAQQAITGTHQEHIQEALELLYKHFPKAFIKEGDCKPLKVGILEDLKPRISDIEGLSVSKVRAAVRFYTSRLRYFYAMREGAMRIDLDGNEIEPVSAEHAEYARTRFSEINAKRRPAKAQAKVSVMLAAITSITVVVLTKVRLRARTAVQTMALSVVMSQPRSVT